MGVFIISSLFQMELGRKKAITICTSKKKKKKYTKPFLGIEISLGWIYWHFSSSLTQMFILPCAPSQWGGVEQSPGSSKAAATKVKNTSHPPQLLSHRHFSRAEDKMTSNMSMTESPLSCIGEGPCAGDSDRGSFSSLSCSMAFSEGKVLREKNKGDLTKKKGGELGGGEEEG